MSMKWNELSVPFKILRAISLLCSPVIIYLMVYEIVSWFGAVTPWETGSLILDLLIPIVLILEGIIDLKKRPGFGIFWIIFGSVEIILYIFLK